MYAGEQQVLAHVAEAHGASLSTEERRFLDLRLERGHGEVLCGRRHVTAP